jgi:hypothetical protein
MTTVALEFDNIKKALIASPTSATMVGVKGIRVFLVKRRALLISTCVTYVL